MPLYTEEKPWGKLLAEVLKNDEADLNLQPTNQIIKMRVPRFSLLRAGNRLCPCAAFCLNQALSYQNPCIHDSPLKPFGTGLWAGVARSDVLGHLLNDREQLLVLGLTGRVQGAVLPDHWRQRHGHGCGWRRRCWRPRWCVWGTLLCIWRGAGPASTAILLSANTGERGTCSC